MIKLEVGCLYSDDEGTLGFCTNSHEGVFLLAFVAKRPETTIFRAYDANGTKHGNPSILKEVFRFPPTQRASE